jgi:hypothetical protein
MLSVFGSFLMTAAYCLAMTPIEVVAPRRGFFKFKFPELGAQKTPSWPGFCALCDEKSTLHGGEEFFVGLGVFEFFQQEFDGL